MNLSRLCRGAAVGLCVLAAAGGCSTSCEPGTERCDGEVLERCDDWGDWAVKESCNPYSLPDGTQTTGVCCFVSPDTQETGSWQCLALSDQNRCAP